VNVASGEYFQVVKPYVEKLADCPLYTMVFKARCPLRFGLRADRKR
jgi:hypothetical protein